MTYRTVILKRGKEESLRRFHPWIFSGAVARVDEGVVEGDVVRVLTAGGDYIATGHYHVGTITVRVLSFTDEEADGAYWRRRLGAAIDVRRRLGIAGGARGDAYRLVHGEGDSLPGLVIDIYGRTAVMQAHTVGMHRSRTDIARALMDVTGGAPDATSAPYPQPLQPPQDVTSAPGEGTPLTGVFYKSESTLPRASADDYEGGFIVGTGGGDVITENGLRFRVDWRRGQKTGFFLDQRDNRTLLERYAAGRRVLNMFCYTGSFSAYAMRGGAAVVHSVDSSEKAVAAARANVEMNFPGDSRHTAYADDAFAFLDAVGEGDYDLIVLDPPAFAKHRSALHNALKGYIRLNTKALRKIRAGGIIFTFSCSQAVTKDNFRNSVFTAAAIAGRRVRVVHQLHQPADHPVNIYHPEGEYLKGLVLYVE